MPWCQRGLHAKVPACQRANFSFLRANVPMNVPYGEPIFQLGVPTCQKVCQFFKHSSNEMLMGNFYTLLLYKEFYIILDIMVTHIVCICIVHKNCIILHFYTSYHIKEKWVEFFFFITFFFIVL